MDIIGDVVSILNKMDPIQAIIAIVLLALISAGWHFITKIYPKQQEYKEKHNARLIEIEERRTQDQASTNVYLREASNTQQILLNQNTEAVKDLKKIMEIMSSTFQVVSEKLAVHDERSTQANAMIASMYENMPSKDAVSKIHTRIDDFAKDFPDKQDIDQIMGQLTSLSTEINKANSILAEIRVRQMSA